MASFAMPQTEKAYDLTQLLSDILLISSVPVTYTDGIYYLPLIGATDLKTDLANWQQIEGTTKDFLEKVSVTALKTISGLSGRLLPAYRSDHSIILMTTSEGNQYVAYGMLNEDRLKLE